MKNGFEQIWETYTSSWKTGSEEERRSLFEASLDPDCRYTDPLVLARGWKPLSAYIEDLQKQVPGVHFVTTKFATHNHKCLAHWEMRGEQAQVLSEGVSYGEFNEAGKLVAMTGFFAAPSA